MLHTHLDEVNCLELLVAEGPNARLKELIERVRRIKSVTQLKFMQTAAI
jgi:metal-responsive CopG/Arc/MetJ family transcriptional regulator